MARNHALLPAHAYGMMFHVEADRSVADSHPHWRTSQASDLIASAGPQALRWGRMHARLRGILEFKNFPRNSAAGTPLADGAIAVYCGDKGDWKWQKALYKEPVPCAGCVDV